MNKSNKLVRQPARRMAAKSVADTCSKADFARENDISRQAVAKYVRAGMPVRPDGSLDRAAAAAWVNDNIDQGRRPTDPRGAARDLNRQRARLAKAQADKCEIENAVRAGSLIERADVVAAWQTVFAHVRAKLLGLPSRMAARMAGMTAPAEIKNALTEVIYEALEDLGRTRGVASNPKAKPAETVGLPRTKKARGQKEPEQ